MQTFLDLRDSIHSFVWLTEVAVNNVNGLDVIHVEAEAYYLTDKGYVDFWISYNKIHLVGAFFVTRAKDNMKYKVKEGLGVDKSTGVISDQNIRLTGTIVSMEYPDLLRLVTYEDFEDGKVYQFITNDFTNEVFTIAELYRARWKVELFFKWTSNIFISSRSSVRRRMRYIHRFGLQSVYIFYIFNCAKLEYFEENREQNYSIELYSRKT